MLKLGCTLPNLASIFYTSQKTTNFFSLARADKELHDKIRKDKTCGPSIVSIRKPVVLQTLILKFREQSQINCGG